MSAPTVGDGIYACSSLTVSAAPVTNSHSEQIALFLLRDCVGVTCLGPPDPFCASLYTEPSAVRLCSGNV